MLLRHNENGASSPGKSEIVVLGLREPGNYLQMTADAPVVTVQKDWEAVGISGDGEVQTVASKLAEYGLSREEIDFAARVVGSAMVMIAARSGTPRLHDARRGVTILVDTDPRHANRDRIDRPVVDILGAAAVASKAVVSGEVIQVADRVLELRGIVSENPCQVSVHSVAAANILSSTDDGRIMAEPVIVDLPRGATDPSQHVVVRTMIMPVGGIVDQLGFSVSLESLPPNCHVIGAVDHAD